jgi:hypothetical protein
MRLNLQIASYLQDGFLRTFKSPEPKYLPVTLGGSGCPALFDSATNLYLSVMAYRGGGYSRLYGSATHEAYRALSSLEFDRVPELALVNRLREKREYFFGTYAEKILVPRPEEISKFREVLPMPLVTARMGRVGTSSFQNRLIRSKLVIGQRMAEIELDFKIKVDQEIFGTSSVVSSRARGKEESLRLRKKFEFALSANTAFTNLLRRQATPKDVTELQKQGFLTSTSGVIDFSLENAKWLFRGGKSENFSLEDIVRVENLYIRDEVSTGETLKVAGIEINPEVGGKRLQQRTSSRVGLYQIDTRQYEWCQEILASLREKRDSVGRPLTFIEEINTYRGKHEWVNDDLSLIEEIRVDMGELPKTATTSIILVTSDRRLARQACNAVNITVYRIEPGDVIRSITHREWNQSVQLSVREVQEFCGINFPQGLMPRAVYIDTGSLAAAAIHFEVEPTDFPDNSVLKRREYIESGSSDTGDRYCLFRSINLSKRRVLYETIYPIDTSWRPREHITRTTNARMSYHKSSHSGSFSTRSNLTE